MRVILCKVFAFSSIISPYYKLKKKFSQYFLKTIFISSIDREVISKGLDLPTCQNYMGANFQVFYVMTHQMWARVVLGRPLCRKMLRISSPDTKPSMSVSAVLNIWSNFILSTGFTTHWMAICKNQTTQVIARSVHTNICKQYYNYQRSGNVNKIIFKVTSKMLFDWFFFFSVRLNLCFKQQVFTKVNLWTLFTQSVLNHYNCFPWTQTSSLMFLYLRPESQPAGPGNPWRLLLVALGHPLPRGPPYPA